MAGAMESLFGGKKDKPQGEAMESIMGGPGGTLSTADLKKAREAYGKYDTEIQTSGGDRLTFEEFVDRVWKPANKK